MDRPRIRVQAGSHRWAAAPTTPPVALPARQVPRANAYQTTGTGPRSTSFNPADYGPNAALSRVHTLRRQARQLRRNGGMAETIVTELTKHIVGTGIVPELSDRAAQAEWERWTDQADADGLCDFYGLQYLAVEEMVEAGACFLRRRLRRPEDGMRVPLQIQLLPMEQLAADIDRPRDANGNETRAGIQFNAISKRTGYWFYSRHPGERGYDGGQPVLVPASEVLHLFQPKRIGQIHGVTWLAPVMGALRDLEDMDDSVRLREANNANFNAFIKRNLPSEFDPETLMKHWSAVDSEVAQSGIARVGLEPGATWILEPGEDVTFANPPGVAGTYESFVRVQHRRIAASVMLLYEMLSGDFSQGNDRLWRAAFNNFKRGIEAVQHHTVVFQALRGVMQWWGAAGRLSGALPADLNTDLVPWTPPAWPYINPVQDIAAAQAEVRAGFSSRTRFLRGRGERAEEIDAENAADRAREDKDGLVYETDPGKVSGAGVTQARPPDNELPDA